MAVLRGKRLDAIRQAWARGALGLPDGRRSQQFVNLLLRLGHPRKTPWNVGIMERYRHGAGVVTYLARSLRGGPIKNARLVGWDGERITFTYRASAEGALAVGAPRQRMTLSRGDFLRRWLRHIPAPHTRTVRSYGLSHHAHTEALARCRTALGQPPVEPPLEWDWHTVCAQRGDAHPEQCPTCGQRLVCTGVIRRSGVSPPRVLTEERAA
jgi:hypothetical protein